MKQHFRPTSTKTSFISASANALGLLLPLAAVVASCIGCLFFKLPVPIENPSMLVLGSIFTVLPLRPKEATGLQALVAFYLMCVPIGELSCRYFKVFFLPANISVSWGAALLLPCLLGYLAERLWSNNERSNSADTCLFFGWGLAFAVIIGHMAVLALLLKKFYGYGYERDPRILGNLCLYFLLFLSVHGKLSVPLFRVVTGAVLAVFYCVLFVMSR